MANTATLNNGSGRQRELVFAYTVAADGSCTVVSSQAFTGRLIGLETIPGSAAPTDLYDVELRNDRGLDLLGGSGADRSTSTKQYVHCKDSQGAVGEVPFTNSKLTLVVANAGNATGGTTQHKAIAHILEI